ncbi:MAG: hypothetical protein AAGC93_22895 [Cyanobacteria bacterium P01_F01_bin.53]
MNNDSDNTRSLLLWLLEAFDPTFSSPSGNGSTSEAGLRGESFPEQATEVSIFEVGSDPSVNSAQHQGSEGVSKNDASSYPSTSSRAVPPDSLQPRFSAASGEVSFTEASSQRAQSFNFGEIHAVQERVQALLKQRLLSEYENNLPLFPWESEVSEYPAEVSDCVPAAAAAVSPLWSTHVSALKVPSLLPKALLDSLFERCQTLAQAPVKQGVRLVRAVEDLFPDQPDLLEPIAKMVLVPAYRSDRAAQEAVIQELANVAGGYDSALPEQKIALSMLAAQEILGALTLSLSADRPCETRNWVTPTGVLSLTATYEAHQTGSSQLTVAAVLPEGGQVRLWDGEIEKLAMRSQPGALDIVLVNPAVDKNYVLEVALEGEAHPLNFSVNLATNHA